jgi:3-isopropylmalate/(R)-2-methylmalate dehydratase large subunit
LPKGVVAKDMMLLLCGALGVQNAFKVVEYGGEAVEALPMQERLVLTNMAAELGAETGPDRARRGDPRGDPRGGRRGG